VVGPINITFRRAAAATLLPLRPPLKCHHYRLTIKEPKAKTRPCARQDLASDAAAAEPN